MKGWISSGQLVKESIDYDANALDNLNDTFKGKIVPQLR